MSKPTNILIGFRNSASDRVYYTSQRHSTFHFYMQVTPKIPVSSSEVVPSYCRCSAMVLTAIASINRKITKLSKSPQSPVYVYVDTRCVSTAVQYSLLPSNYTFKYSCKKSFLCQSSYGFVSTKTVLKSSYLKQITTRKVRFLTCPNIVIKKKQQQTKQGNSERQLTNLDSNTM